jgi:hypothetical protein
LADSQFFEKKMFGDLPALVALRRARPLLMGLVVTIVLANSGKTTELRLPANITLVPRAEFERFLADRSMPASEEERNKLFREFLQWRKAREHR